MLLRLPEDNNGTCWRKRAGVFISLLFVQHSHIIYLYSNPWFKKDFALSKQQQGASSELIVSQSTTSPWETIRQRISWLYLSSISQAFELYVDMKLNTVNFKIASQDCIRMGGLDRIRHSSRGLMFNMIVFGICVQTSDVQVVNIYDEFVTTCWILSCDGIYFMQPF